MQDRNALEQIDKKYIWHPFTQHSVWDEEPILIIERGEGNELIDVSGARYLDGISALWCNVHGHSEERLQSALKAQVELLCHNTLLGASHRPIIELTEQLSSMLPEGLSRLFYCDGGSVAVEAAIRMAIEWWQKQNTPVAQRRSTLVSLASGYHGDTLGSVGLGYVEVFHQHLRSVVVPSRKMPPPHLFRFYEGMSEADAVAASLNEFKSLFQKEADTIAACVIEPRVQGAAGIWPHPPEFLREVAALCRAHEVLLICDEIATGFGKTGELFAVQTAGVTPDLLTMGKGLSGGLLPIAAVAASERVFEGFRAAPEELKTFFFGQTFSGNPLAARVSCESLKLFQERDLLRHARSLAKRLELLLQEHIAPLAHVDEIRQCGLMVGIELTAEPGGRKAYPISEMAGHRITLAARERGVIVRPLGNVMILMPSLSYRFEELERLVSCVAESIVATLAA